MRNHCFLAAAVAAAILIAGTAPAGAQNAGKNPPKADAKAKQAKAAPVVIPAGGAGGAAYPQRPPAAADMIARGKALFEAQCGFCHGEDARGGDMGNNLIRAQVVLNDDSGEKLVPVLMRGEGVEGTLMPKFNFTDAQIADIAAFLHSFRVNGYDGSRVRPETILVGDAQAGQQFFTQRCASCHTGASDLKGIATRNTDVRTLQQRWLNPSGGGRGIVVTPTTVTVTAGAEKVNGRLVRIDDFLVSLTTADGIPRTFRRDGDNPKVEVHDPFQPHKDLLKVYTDKNIHDVTAYLVTLK
ncbi:MAG: c-type cytochrome [Acidobacteriota bacterium]